MPPEEDKAPASPETAPPASTAEPQLKDSYSRDEVATLLQQAKDLGRKEVQAAKDKEVSRFQRKNEELESFANIASLSDEDKLLARDLDRIKKTSIDSLVKHGLIPDTSKRRLERTRTINEFWEEVDTIQQEGGRGQAKAPDKGSDIEGLLKGSTSADHAITDAKGAPARTGGPPTDPQEFWAQWNKMKVQGSI